MTPYLEWTGTTGQGLNTGILRLLKDGQEPGGAYRFACAATELKIISLHALNDLDSMTAGMELRRFLRRAGYAAGVWERRKVGSKHIYVPLKQPSKGDIICFPDP